MSTCEKCWSDAHRGPQFSVAEEYEKLMRERRNNPCSPEEQAGPNAGVCSKCGKRTLHQVTGEPMCGCTIVYRSQHERLTIHELRELASIKYRKARRAKRRGNRGPAK